MEDNTFEIIKRIGIVICVLLVIAICGLLVNKKLNNKTIKASDNNIAIVDEKKEDIVDVEKYSTILNQLYDNLDNIFLYDNTVKRIDFYANKKCDKTGAKVNLNSNGYTVNYTCVKEVSKKEWEIKGKIDNTIDFTYTTNNKNKIINYYRINNYIIKMESGSLFNTSSITIYDSKTGNILSELKDIITPFTYTENDKKYNSNMYVKKGILYYHIASNITVDEISNEDVSNDCSINMIDFNKDYNSEKIHNYVCSYIRGK